MNGMHVIDRIKAQFFNRKYANSVSLQEEKNPSISFVAVRYACEYPKKTRMRDWLQNIPFHFVVVAAAFLS